MTVGTPPTEEPDAALNMELGGKYNRDVRHFLSWSNRTVSADL